jgi:hypothetical protein
LFFEVATGSRIAFGDRDAATLRAVLDAAATVEIRLGMRSTRRCRLRSKPNFFENLKTRHSVAG